MASERARDIDDLPSHDQASAAATRINPTQNDFAAARLLLSKAFRYLLVVIPFPAIAWLLWLWNFHGTYFQHNDRPRLCGNLTSGHCDTLVSIPVPVMSAVGLFVFVSLFILDHYLLVSPVFNPSHAGGTPSTTVQTESQGESILTGQYTEKQGRCACAVLQFSALAACLLSALCTSLPVGHRQRNFGPQVRLPVR